jgi:4-hydroxy 2-oxovalerate aldolase
MDTKSIQVLDCSIRDGGLINDHRFTDDFVRAVHQALSEARIDYMEIGYRSSKILCSPSDFGAWKFSDDERIRAVTEGMDSPTKLSVMVDAHRIKEQAFAPAVESPISMVRTATYVKDIDLALGMIRKAHDLGYESTANIMAISREKEEDLIQALDKLADSPVDVVYIVDSFGGLYCEQVKRLTELFKSRLPGKKVGIHCHNNLQMAFCNTIAAILNGADFVDGSLSGIGRGCGNCCLELILGYLRNPRHRIEPVFRVIEEQLLPLRDKIEWGYIMPYMITGLLNQHPRAAIAVRKTGDRDKYASFYTETLKNSEPPAGRTS